VTGIRKGSRILLVTDGKDAKGSPAARGLQAGIDYLLTAGMKVAATETPARDDANSIWMDPKRGKRALRRLLAKPVDALLSFEGRVSQLAELPPTAYEQARRETALRYSVRTRHLDREVAIERKRLHPPPVTEEEEEDLGKPVEDPPWTEAVDLAMAFDDGVKEARRYLSAPNHYHDIMVLWAAATHCVESEEIWLSVMPQLGFVSRHDSAGKSVALQCVAMMAFRGTARSSYTASTLFRRIHQYHVTYCLTELHNILHPTNTDLLAVLNACHRRDESLVDRTEQLPDGSRRVRTYSCWAALAWGAIGAPPMELLGRAIVLPLKPALLSERDKLRHGSPKKSKPFVTVRRRFAAWSKQLKSLPDPAMPSWLYNREGDNWRVLFAVAELAGADWPDRVRTAAEKLHALDRPESFEVRLLTGIRNAFKDDPAQPDRLNTGTILERLRKQEELGLREANRDRDLTEYWLRESVRGLITNPDHSKQWKDANGKSPPKNVRGYYRSQFAESFARYLRKAFAHKGGSLSGTSGTSGTEPQKRQARAKCSVPDHAATGTDPEPEISRDGNGLDGLVPDIPDVADTPPPVCARESAPFPEKTNDDNGLKELSGSSDGVHESAARYPESSESGSSLSFSPIDPVIRQLVLECRADHPEWSVETIRRRLHLKKSVVWRVLGNGQPQ